MSVSFNRWIVTILLAIASTAAFASDEVKTTLTATDAGKIYFNSAEKDATYGQLYKHTAVFDMPIWGELRFPPNMTADKVPVMVVMHSSGGIDKRVYDWVDFFNKMGVATFMIDSFTPRGIQSTATDQSQLNISVSSADSLLALKLLATHPRIDASKIGVIGWSKGGIAAMTASFEKLRASLVPGDLKYALHVPFYGGCNQYAKTTGAPILMFTGTKDDWNTLEDCQSNVDKLKGLGADLKFVVYEGAMHGFDTENSRIYAPKAQTWVKCTRRIDLDRIETRIKGSEQVATQEEITAYSKSCMTLGVTIGGNSEYREKSRQEVKDFVTKKFGLGD